MTTQTRRRRPARLHAEALEARDVPSVTLKQVVTIRGGPGADQIDISLDNGAIRVVHSQGGEDTTSSYDPARVARFVIYGDAGNDSIRNSTSIPTIQYGGAGNDSLHGGGAADGLYGEAGNDELEGGRGGDLLAGGVGDDTYRFVGPGLGSDRIVEPASADTDVLDLSAVSRPSVVGAPPNPNGVRLDLASTSFRTVFTGLALTLSTATGIEQVRGSAFNDSIKGNARDNVIVGNGGADVILGLAGNDVLGGGPGMDSLHGGAGDDIVFDHE